MDTLKNFPVKDVRFAHLKLLQSPGVLASDGMIHFENGLHFSPVPLTTANTEARAKNDLIIGLKLLQLKKISKMHLLQNFKKALERNFQLPTIQQIPLNFYWNIEECTKYAPIIGYELAKIIGKEVAHSHNLTNETQRAMTQILISTAKQQLPPPEIQRTMFPIPGTNIIELRAEQHNPRLSGVVQNEIAGIFYSLRYGARQDTEITSQKQQH